MRLVHSHIYNSLTPIFDTKYEDLEEIFLNIPESHLCIGANVGSVAYPTEIRNNICGGADGSRM